MSNKEPMCYIGRSSCGCARAVVVDNPQHAKQVAKDVASFIKDGLTIERVTCEYVRTTPGLFRCTHKEKP